MKRILSIVTLVAFGLIVASPLAEAQKPSKDKGKDDEQSFPGPRAGGARSAPRSNTPVIPRSQPPVQRPSQPRSFTPPQEDPRPRLPQVQQPQGQPSRRELPRFPQEEPRPKQPQGKPSGGQQGGIQGDPRRLNPPQPSTPRQPSQRELPRFPQEDPRPKQPQGKPSGGQQGDPRRIVPSQPQPKSRVEQPPVSKKTDVAPPRRGDLLPRGGTPTIPEGGRREAGNVPATVVPGKTPEIKPPTRDPESARRVRPAPINPSGKPRNVESGAPKTGAIEAVNVPKATEAAPTIRRPLGRPSQPSEKRSVERTGRAKEGVQNVTAAPSAKKVAPSTTSTEVKGVDAPARMQRIPKRMTAQAGEDGGEDVGFKPRAPRPQAKPIRPVTEVVHPPEGGRQYHHGDYHHEYSTRSSWSFGIGFSDGGTSLAFGYSSGPSWGGYPYSYGGGFYNPYWHHHCYSPVFYQPCYPVYPVYYAPVYQPLWVNPYAYNSSSFAFGYSSFGGSAFSSFGFAYSSSNWGIGFGWASAPAYTIYTPVYDPYFHSVWTPGYYEIVSERAWVPGSYEEVVNTPVVETVVDPLGNTYDTVIQAGSVDYVWREGYWTVERRRIWVPGHFEYVAAF